MQILLINTGNDPGIGGNANAQAYPPLGVTSLATTLLEAFPNQLQIELIDGQVDAMDDIVARLRSARPALCALSMYSTSIRNTVRLAQEAKALGAVTLLGNDHAAFHHETLLRNVREIDFICTLDEGERFFPAFVQFLRGKATRDGVPGLAYRRGDGSVALNPEQAPGATIALGGTGRKSALDYMPLPDRSLLPDRYWQHYLRHFRLLKRKEFDPSGVTGVATINRARGCARSKNRCRYCGIADLTPRGASPARFWDDVRLGRRQVNANLFYESFDSATSWPALCESWADARPDDLSDTRFFMYAQAAETTPRTVSAFAKLGVFCINTGFDSGDTPTLRRLKGPHDSLETNRNAARLWTDAGVEIYTSFVLTGLGNELETRRSLDNTLTFAQWLATSTSTVSLDSAMFYPDRSAPVGRWIWFPHEADTQAAALGWDFIDRAELLRVSARWRDEVFLDPLELCADFARVCGVQPELLLEYDQHVKRVSQSAGLNYGQSQGGPQ